MSLFEVSDFFSYGAFDDYDVQFSSFSSVTVNNTAVVDPIGVPEPSTAILMLLAVTALVNVRRSA